MLPFVMKAHTLQNQQSLLSYNFPLWVEPPTFSNMITGGWSHFECLLFTFSFCLCRCWYRSLTDKGKCSTVIVIAPFDPQVYDRVAGEEVLPLDRRLRRLRSHCGPVAGSLFALFAVLDFLFLLLLRWLAPDRHMDMAVDATGPNGLWKENRKNSDAGC